MECPGVAPIHSVIGLENVPTDSKLIVPWPIAFSRISGRLHDFIC